MKVLLLLLLCMQGCDNPPNAVNHLPLGTVRSVDTYNDNVVFETDSGYVTSFHVCGVIPVWKGMRAELDLQWEGTFDCAAEPGAPSRYPETWGQKIVLVTHHPPDIKEVK